MESIRKITWLNSEDSQKIHVHTGDVYQFKYPVSTRANVNYLPGDLLLVQKRTRETPHGEVGPRGYNWVCITHANNTVWATLEHCIERGLLVKVHQCRHKH